MTSLVLKHLGKAYEFNKEELFDIYKYLSGNRIFISNYKTFADFKKGLWASIDRIHSGQDYAGFCGFVVFINKHQDNKVDYHVKVALDAYFVRFKNSSAYRIKHKNTSLLKHST